MLAKDILEEELSILTVNEILFSTIVLSEKTFQGILKKDGNPVVEVFKIQIKQVPNIDFDDKEAAKNRKI